MIKALRSKINRKRVWLVENEFGQINSIEEWSLGPKRRKPLVSRTSIISETALYYYYILWLRHIGCVLCLFLFNMPFSLYQNFLTCCITISAFLPGLILMKYEVTAHVTIYVTALCYNWQCGAENAVIAWVFACGREEKAPCGLVRITKETLNNTSDFCTQWFEYGRSLLTQSVHGMILFISRRIFPSE